MALTSRTLIDETGNQLNYDTWQKNKNKKREEKEEGERKKNIYIYIYIK